QQPRFLASKSESGILRAGRLTIKHQWLKRAFREVRGTTALQQSKLLIANLVLEPDLEIRNFSAEFADLARGRLNLEMNVAAFGGTIRAEALAEPREQMLTFDASGKFTQIDLARFAIFSGLS